jgi:hypothetical protein
LPSASRYYSKTSKLEAKQYVYKGFSETNITDAAVRASTCKVQLTKKNFAMSGLSMYELRSAVPPERSSCYGLRIVFDKSPYPPPGEWRQDTGGMWDEAEEHKFWEYWDFYRESEKSIELVRGNEAERTERKRDTIGRSARFRLEREAEGAKLAQDSASGSVDDNEIWENNLKETFRSDRSKGV